MWGKLNEAIDSMQGSFASHRSGFFHEASHQWFSNTVQGSYKSTLAKEFFTSVPRSNSVLMLCKSHLKSRLQFQWSAIPTVLKEYRPPLRSCYQFPNTLLKQSLSSLSMSRHLPLFVVFSSGLPATPYFPMTSKTVSSSAMLVWMERMQGKSLEKLS